MKRFGAGGVRGAAVALGAALCVLGVAPSASASAGTARTAARHAPQLRTLGARTVQRTGPSNSSARMGSLAPMRHWVACWTHGRPVALRGHRSSVWVLTWNNAAQDRRHGWGWTPAAAFTPFDPHANLPHRAHC